MTISIVNQTRLRGAALLAVFLAQSFPAIAQQPTQAQRDAIRQACPTDYRAYCADVPAGGKAALACLQQHAADLSQACQRAVKAASGGSAPPRAAPSSGAAGATTAPSVSARPVPAMPLREQLMVLRQSCAGDYRALCSGVPLGGGRAIACLRANASSLSPQCGEALSGARQGR